MKVLLSFFNAVYSQADKFRMPLFYEAFSRGLVEHGNEVLIYHNKFFGGNSQSISEEDADKIRQFCPELVIAFNNHGPDWSKIVDCPICIYEVDSALYYSNVDAIRQHPNVYHYLVLQPQSRQYILANYGVDQSRIQYTRNFTAIRAKKCQKVHNISFLGSRFHDRAYGDFPWLSFQKSVPTTLARKAYGNLIRKILDNPFLSAKECDDFCLANGIPMQSVPNLVMALSSSKRIKILSSVIDLGLDLYGSPDWVASDGEDPELVLAYNHDKLCTVEDNQRLYNESRVCLNVNHVQAVNAFSWRVLDIMASDGCLVTELNNEFSRLFSSLGVPAFRNGWEAHERCSYVLNNPSFRDEVVQRCNEEIERNWRFDKVMEIIEDCVDVRLTSDSTVSGSLSFIDVNRQYDISIIARMKKSKRVRAMYYAIMLFGAQLPCFSRFRFEKKAVEAIKNLA